MPAKKTTKPSTTKSLWKTQGGKKFANLPLLRELDSSVDRVQSGNSFDTTNAAPVAQLRLNALSASRAPAAESFDATPTAPVTGTANWTPLGPLVIPNGQTYSSIRANVSGRITAIAIDPFATQTIYAGSAQGGVWKTTDAGASWAPMSDNQPSLAIGAVILDPNNPRIVYAATGEGNFSADSYYGLGVIKSTDGGATWTPNGSITFAGKRFCRLAIHASNSSIIFAAVSNGIHRSTNAGATWTPLAGGLPTSDSTEIAFDPGNGNVAYAAFYGNGVYKTTNATAAAPAWVKLAGGLPTAQLGRIVLAISPSSPSTIYALIGNGATDNIDRFFISTNSGANWSAIPLPTGNIGGQSFYNIHLTVDPTTPDIVYLCGISFWKAVRSGATWTITDIGGGFHPDCHFSVIDPSNHQTIYAGSDGGIYRSTNGGTAWDDSINKGICITQFEFIDDHPTSGASVFGGTQDNGTEQYRNHPVFYHADEGDGGCAIINDNRPSNVLSTYYGASPKLSTQGGKFGTWNSKWNGITGNALFYPPMAACDTDSNRIAIGTDRVNIDTTQGSGGWPTKIPATGGLGSVSAIAFLSPTLLYAANTAGQIFKIAGSTVTTISQAPLPTMYVWDIAALPGKTNEIVIVMSGFGVPHVWRAVVPATGPATWTDISSNLPDIPVNALVIDSVNPATFYVGTDIGVFRTLNTGGAWSLYSNGLPNCAIYDLKLHQPSRVLRAATHGRGLWEIPVDAAVTPPADLVFRDHPMDTARVFPTPNATAAWDDPLHYVTLGSDLYWWMSADVKVDALEGATPAYQMPVSQVDYIQYETKLQHRNAQRGRVNRVYVQMQNRGFQPAANVHVKLLYADASAGLPDLPADFWTAFPADSADTSQWRPIGSAQTIVAASPGIPTILEWDWTPPLAAATHSCLLAVMDSATDPIPAAAKVSAIGALVPAEKRVTLKNLHLVDPALAPSASIRFVASSRKVQTIRVVPHTPNVPNVTFTFDPKFVDRIQLWEGFKKPTLPRGKTGKLQFVIPKEGVDATIKIAALSAGESPASFSVIQYEGETIVGGSTYVIRPKS